MADLKKPGSFAKGLQKAAKDVHNMAVDFNKPGSISKGFRQAMHKANIFTGNLGHDLSRATGQTQHSNKFPFQRALASYERALFGKKRNYKGLYREFIIGVAAAIECQKTNACNRPPPQKLPSPPPPSGGSGNGGTSGGQTAYPVMIFTDCGGNAIYKVYYDGLTYYWDANMMSPVGEGVHIVHAGAKEYILVVQTIDDGEDFTTDPQTAYSYLNANGCGI